MTVTFYSTDFESVGSGSGSTFYKDLNVTASTGDLIVVASSAEGCYGTQAPTVVTQAGSTSAWATGAKNYAQNTPSLLNSHAVAQGNGTVTIRVSHNISSGLQMGVAAWVVSADSWGGTPAYVSITLHNSDELVGVTTTATRSKVFFNGADYSAGDVGFQVWPAGGSPDLYGTSAGRYSYAQAHWDYQAAGSGSYGYNGALGTEWAVGAVVVDEGGGTPPQTEQVTTSALVASGTPSTTGTTWANTTNVNGTNNAAFATWTSSSSGASGSITPSGYGAQAAMGGSAPVSVDSVDVTVYAYVSNATRVSSISVQLTDGGTPIGSPQTMTKSTTSTNNQKFTFTGVTWAQLANLGVRITFTRGGVTTQSICYVDAAPLTVTYTRNVQTPVYKDIVCGIPI